jgi:hypothetical protein
VFSRLIVSRIAWVQNCPKPGQFIQAAAHRDFPSEVNAAERPSPYCQTA